MFPVSIPLTFLNLISVCSYQYAELGLFFTMPFVGIRIISALMCHFAVSTPDEILSLCTGDQYLHFSATPCGVFIIFSSCFVFSLPTLFCRLSVVWIDSCKGRTKAGRQPIKQVRKNSGCWLSGYLVSEKMTSLQFYSFHTFFFNFCIIG